MSEETAAKVAKLPAWAREIIKDLQTQPERQGFELRELHRRVDDLCRQNRKLQDRNDAMHQMFECAARGGNEVAAAVKKIFEEYVVTGEEQES